MQKIHELIKKLCPNGVEYKNIQELCKISRGKVMSKDFIKSNAGEYPVYSSQTENNGELGKISTYDFDGEYLTWTTDGANAGSVFYRKGKFSVTNVCGLLEIKNKVMIPKFLYYVLSIEAPKYVNAGMGNPKLMSNVMAKIRVAVPSLEVQCEIVHVLDDFTLLSALLSAELKARKNQYNYYLEKLLCNDKNAKIYKLKELCVFFNGDRGKNYPKVSEMVNKGVPFVNAGDVNRVIDYKNCNKITLEKYNSMNGAKLRKNDILYCLRGSTGKNGIYELDEGTVASSLVAIRVNSIINYKYLYYLLNSSLERRQRYKSDTGAAQPNLSVQSISNYEFPVPNMEEQNKIVNILDKFEKLCNDISQGLPAEIEARKKQYEYYRDKLLTFKELKVNE
jgi:type I restriction enzyme S subunit